MGPDLVTNRLQGCQKIMAGKGLKVHAKLPIFGQGILPSYFHFLYANSEVSSEPLLVSNKISTKTSCARSFSFINKNTSKQNAKTEIKWK